MLAPLSNVHIDCRLFFSSSFLLVQRKSLYPRDRPPECVVAMTTGIEDSFVSLQLLLETAVGPNTAPLFLDKRPRLFQVPFVRLHDVGDDRGSGPRDA